MTILNETETDKKLDTEAEITSDTKAKRVKRFRLHTYLFIFLAISAVFLIANLSHMIDISRAANDNTYKITKDSMIVNYATGDESAHIFTSIAYFVYFIFMLVIVIVVSTKFKIELSAKLEFILIPFLIILTAAGFFICIISAVEMRSSKDMYKYVISQEDKYAFIESHIGADYENVIIGNKRAYLTPENKFYELNDKLEGRTRTWTLDELKR
jgi:hypothetical protein